jgi:formamidopyrimidine-DNA glycosylase
MQRVRVRSPFLVRSFDPPVEAAEGRRVCGLRRLGKRIALDMGDAEATRASREAAGVPPADAGKGTSAATHSATNRLFLVFHLMIAGRFRWAKAGADPPGRIGLAAFDFDGGTLLLVEASQKKRASLHVVRGEAALAEHRPAGLEILDADLPAFRERLLSANHTLKRALTDPRLFAGVGNAYSDEILHAAGLSPVKLTRRLEPAEIERLFAASRETLTRWIQTLREQFAGRFPGPGQITAFRDDFAVHGRFGKPCPACGSPVQRIRYAENETNYCPTCQTAGRILADRSLSRLLKDDWPRSLEELAG